ncbi:MAG: 1-phosphofructokinase family hexose kinase [Anaerolineae bacterium]
MYWTVTLNAVIDHVYLLADTGADTTGLARESRHVPAGKGVNVSRALASLGATSVAVVVCDAMHAPRYRAALEKAGAQPRLVIARPDVRHHATIVQSDGRHLHARERGSECSPGCVEGVLAALADVAPGDSVALSGSLPPGLPADTYTGLIRHVQHRGATAWVDCEGTALASALTAAPHGVKVNGVEAGALWGVAVGDVAQAAAVGARFLDGGAAIACVTLGPAGLVIRARTGSVHARSTPPRAGSGVGSGDSALAAIMVATTEPRTLADTALFAAAAGAANVGSTDPGTFAAADLAASLRQATVRALL